MASEEGSPAFGGDCGVARELGVVGCRGWPADVTCRDGVTFLKEGAGIESGRSSKAPGYF